MTVNPMTMQYGGCSPASVWVPYPTTRDFWIPKCYHLVGCMTDHVLQRINKLYTWDKR